MLGLPDFDYAKRLVRVAGHLFLSAKPSIVRRRTTYSILRHLAERCVKILISFILELFWTWGVKMVT